MKKSLLILIPAIFATGCTTLQKITPVDAGKVHEVCIVEHAQVRKTVLAAIEEGLTRNNVNYRVIPGSYIVENRLWMPSFQSNQTSGCDAMLFYVADWTLGNYTYFMHFANIWMSTPDKKTRLGGARYDTRASWNESRNAHDEIVELVNGLFSQYKSTN